MLDLIQAYENYLTKVKKASENTIASYMRDIRQYAEWMRISEKVDVIDLYSICEQYKAVYGADPV